jgi:hypothetical protein
MRMSFSISKSLVTTARVVYKREMLVQEEADEDSASDESFDLNDAIGIEQGGFC